MRTREYLVAYAPYAGLLVAALLIVRLSVELRTVTGDYTELLERLRSPHAGYMVPTFETETVAGERVTIGEASPGSRQLLLIFDTACPYCRASLPAWREIAGTIRSQERRIAVLGLAVDEEDGPIRAYRQEHGFDFPVLRFPQPKLRRLYRATAVPLIVLLDSDGRVLYSRLGVLDEPAAIDSVLAALRGMEGPGQDARFGAMSTRDRDYQGAGTSSAPPDSVSR